MFGYSAAEAVGQSITILIPHERLGEETETLERIRRGETLESFETVRRRRDGALIEISLSVSPIRDASGTVIGASKIARDITEHRRIESALQTLQQRLMGLATASAGILASPEVEAVIAATIAQARDAFAANGCALWRAEDRGAWKVAGSFGLSDAFDARVIAQMAIGPCPANSKPRTRWSSRMSRRRPCWPTCDRRTRRRGSTR